MKGGGARTDGARERKGKENRHERAGKEERGAIRRTGERRLAVWF